MGRSALMTLAAALLLAPAARAQRGAPAACTRTATDTVVTTVYLALARHDVLHDRNGVGQLGRDSSEALGVGLVLQMLQEQWNEGASLALLRPRPVWLVGDEPPATWKLASPGAGVNFVLRRDGRIDVSGDADRADRADDPLQAILRRAHDARMLGGITLPFHGDSLVLRLGTATETTGAEAVLAAWRGPMARYAEESAVPKISNPSPHYPVRDTMRLDLGAPGTPEKVTAQYVVDATGRVDMKTLRFPSDYVQHAFREEIRRVLPSWRFTPARVGGCPVRQLVQQPFVFRTR